MYDETRITSEAHLAGVWEFLRREVAAGHQGYIVYPVSEESKLELKAAIAEFERLSKQVLPKLKLGLLNGRLSSEEKEAVMLRMHSMLSCLPEHHKVSSMYAKAGMKVERVEVV